MTSKRYAVILEPASTGFSAYSPDVPGCAAAGDTLEETHDNFQEALDFISTPNASYANPSPNRRPTSFTSKFEPPDAP